MGLLIVYALSLPKGHNRLVCIDSEEIPISDWNGIDIFVDLHLPDPILEPMENQQNNDDPRFQHNQAEPPRTMDDYLTPRWTGAPSCIVDEAQGANAYQVKPNVLTHIPNFHGMTSEMPYFHVKEFKAIIETMCPAT